MFTVYQGLTSGIERGRWKDQRPPARDILVDLSWHLTNFFAGGIAGLSFTATVLPMYRGLQANPLMTHKAFPILSKTFLKTGTMFALSSMLFTSLYTL
jgi:hypothetical protein